MVRADAIAALHIDRQVDDIADCDGATAHGASVRVQPAERLHRVLDLDLQSCGGADRAGVAGLPTALAVERGLVG